MADLQAPPKKAVTPRQLVLIGVLSVILVAVLIGQFGGASNGTKAADAGSTAGKPAAAPALNAAPKPATSSATPAAESAQAKPAAPAWPKLTADAAAQYDPFAVPDALTRQLAGARKGPDVKKPIPSAPAKKSNAGVVAALRSKGIAAVLWSERGAAAVIGNRTMRVGDVVEGHRVVSIDPQGVLLEPVVEQTPPQKRK